MVLRNEARERGFHLASSTGLAPEEAAALFSASGPEILRLASSRCVPFELVEPARPSRHEERGPDPSEGPARIDLVVPIAGERELLGWIVLGARLSGALFSGEDREMLEWLASHASTAIADSIVLERNEALKRDLEERDADNRQLQEMLLRWNEYLTEEVEAVSGDLDSRRCRTPSRAPAHVLLDTAGPGSPIVAVKPSGSPNPELLDTGRKVLFRAR